MDAGLVRSDAAGDGAVGPGQAQVSETGGRPTLREQLAGKRMFLTGATGFVGEALLERLLTDFADLRLSVLVRARGGQSATDRFAALLEKPAFGRLRETRPVEELLAAVQVVDGDLSSVPPLPDDVDIVIHCAGEVSFDPEIAEGFAANLGGLREVLRVTKEAAQRGGRRPHFLHVSTAYVAGLRAGLIPEGPLHHAVDWQVEEAAAQRAQTACEEATRTPEALAGYNNEAAEAVGRAGLPAVAAEAERLRVRDVHKRRVDAGRERARSLGWTDCYTFTKALTERYLEQNAGDLPFTVVRPSIIESALARPYAGWIEGFKMAEPLILAYGRGELPDFPSAPDGVIDIIPVDLVVNAIVAAAANPPADGEPAHYYQVCSGRQNPLLFQDLYDIVHDYFGRKPLIKRGRGEIAAHTWAFAGASRIEARLERGEKVVKFAERALGMLPRSSRLRETAKELDRTSARLRFLRRYQDLYKSYTQAELIYDDTNTAALHAALSSGDQAEFGFDPTGYDWRGYLERHCDSVTAGLRYLQTTPGKPPVSLARDLPAGDGRQLAVFDLDGTLVSSTVVESYLWLRLAAAPRGRVPRELAELARHAPGWIRAERADRGRLIREVYRRYAGADLEALAHLVDEEVGDHLLSRVSAEALRRVRAHRAAGHRTVLLTGSLGLLIRPLAPLFDEVVAAELAVDGNGRATGRLATAPVVGEARAAWLRFSAPRLGADIADSWAYADSTSDLPMLRAVGHPVVVNPDLQLARIARREKWPTVGWPLTPGVERVALAGTGAASALAHATDRSLEGAS
ncbi:MAG: alcohol-forming fatty acyl-CoA reductase [Frankiaceae bacterium]|nr:alcohol-forming fatty acyl-CoA reductase [Frankiaceae bacterium]